MYDNAGKWQVMYAAEIAATFGLQSPLGLNQRGLGDLLPPTLTSLTVQTPTVDTAPQSALVVAALSFTDDASGISYALLMFCSFSLVCGGLHGPFLGLIAFVI